MSLRADSAARSSASPWRFKLFAAAVEFAGDAAELAGRLVAELHQMLRHHRQLGAAVADPLRQDLEQRLERLRFAAHRDDRAGEPLGFLAPGAAEHQPDEAQQRQRTGGDREPLRDQRRRQRLPGERAARPTRRYRRATARRGRRARCRAPARSARTPRFRSARLAATVPASNVGSPGPCRARQLEGLCRSLAGGRGSARLRGGCHRNVQFTIFDGARKRLERVRARAGRMRAEWRSAR